MQINQMMRGLVGELKPTEAKTLELKPGQVVKGMVLQLLGDQDALVNIGGVQVRARLELPLQQGQVAFLQVQPESNGSQTVLKPIGAPVTQLTDESLAGLLQSFGMKDGPQIRLLAKQLQQADIPLTKGNLQSFAQAVEQAPPSVPADQWLEAAIVAHKRNLPMTREAVGSLREAMFGQPLAAQLDSLEAKAADARKTLAWRPNGAAGEVRELLDKLDQAIRAVKAAAEPPGTAAPAQSGGPSQASAAALSPDSPSTVSMAAAPGAEGQERASLPSTAGAAIPAEPGREADHAVQADSSDRRGTAESREPAARPAGQQSPAGQQTPAAKADGGVPQPGTALPNTAPEPGTAQPDAAPKSGTVLPGTSPQPGTALPGTALPGTAPESRSALPDAAPEAEMAEPGQAGVPRRPESRANADQPLLPADAGDAEAAPEERTAAARTNEPANRPADGPERHEAHGRDREATQSRTPPKADDNWISRLFKAVGMDNEHQVSRALAKAEHGTPAAPPGFDPAAVLPATPADERHAAAEVNRHAAADSLKSVLLQLSGSNAVPEPLREQAQQALQQITGQQLLLSPDRSAVLTHVTLLLPMRQGDGGQTAAIHVQSRRGRRGEIDAHNCRLLFDLNMNTIGLTLVDVQVYDRKVYVQVHNDMPFLGKLLERYRGEIEQGLGGNGYQCMSLKCGPFPQPVRTDGEASAASPVPAASATAYRVKPYKGVDMRV